MKIEIILCIVGMSYASFLLFKIIRNVFKERKKEILEAEKCLLYERKKRYSLFLQQNLTQAVNDLYFRINEPKFNSDDLIYILNKNGLYVVDVDTFDESYDKGK